MLPYIWVFCLCHLCIGFTGCADGNETADLGREGICIEDTENELSAELTAEEQEYFTEFANMKENNGFLLSQYEEVSKADLNEILYNGAGIESDPLSEEERKAYEAKAYPVESDITRLTTEQIDAFLQRKAGISMADMEGSLDWVYLDMWDSYVFQHGDTNFCTFVCTGGTRTGKVFELHLKAAEEYVSDCIVTLEKNGDDYQFVSNRFCENAGDIR